MNPFERAARELANTRGSKGSRAIYNGDLDRWLAYCGDHGIDPTAPTLEQASGFKDHVESLKNARGEKFSPLTTKRIMATLSAMYAHAVNKEQPLATWNPWKAVPHVRADSIGRTREISAEDAEKVMAAAAKEGTPNGLRDALIMRLMFETGIRRQSVVTIRRDDVYERDGVTVARIVVKGSKRTEIVLADGSVAALERWLEVRPSSPYLFPALRGGGSLHPSAVNKLVADWSRTVGVSASPHQFRAAFATTALDAGVPLHEVQAAMHHADPKTTLRYDRGTRGGGVSAAVSAFRKKEK